MYVCGVLGEFCEVKGLKFGEWMNIGGWLLFLVVLERKYLKWLDTMINGWKCCLVIGNKKVLFGCLNGWKSCDVYGLKVRINKSMVLEWI